jgi:hypothetical protein
MKSFIAIRKYGDDKIIVKKIDVTGKSERQIERVDDGININLNHTDFYTELIYED